MNTARNSAMKGRVKRKPATPCRLPARFRRPPGTRVVAGAAAVVLVVCVMSCVVVGGSPPPASPLADYYPATVRPCSFAYLTTASCHGCKAAVAPAPWSTDLALMASPWVAMYSWIGLHCQFTSTALAASAYTLLTCWPP